MRREERAAARSHEQPSVHPSRPLPRRHRRARFGVMRLSHLVRFSPDHLFSPTVRSPAPLSAPLVPPRSAFRDPPPTFTLRLHCA